MLREAMHRKAITININAWGSVFASVVVILVAIFVFPKNGVSLYFCGGTILMMLVCDFFTWKYHKNVNRKTMNGDLLTVAKTMKKLKHDYQNWVKYGVAMVVIWLGWFSVEVAVVAGSWKTALSTIISLVVGGLVGSVCGLLMHKKVVDTADEIIRQIEE